MAARILFALIVIATLTLTIAPELTRPLFVKYYRTMYAAEVIRPS